MWNKKTVTENKLDLSKPIAIYGHGNSGKKIALKLIELGIKINFFIDQKADDQMFVNGIRSIKPSEINHQVEQVIIGIFNRDVNPRDITSLLKSKQIKTIIGYHELNFHIPGVIQKSFWYDPTLDFIKYEIQSSKLTNILCDESSKLTLKNILNFRKSGKVSEHPDGTGLNNQYFDKEIRKWDPDKKQIIIDCGAYTGDTILSAIENDFPLLRAYCFEPDIQNFSKLTKNLTSYPTIEIISIPCASWNKTMTLYLSEPEGEGSRVVKKSSIPVQALSLDDFFVNSCFDFLKIDVEGAEIETLQGAIKSILKNRPIFAVAVYHKPEDLWEIPIYLYENLKNYKYYLRQYGHNGFDTIFYCFPRDEKYEG
jgi:FkbM family methyltransferase